MTKTLAIRVLRTAPMPQVSTCGVCTKFTP
jgi:hypothetical protein